MCLFLLSVPLSSPAWRTPCFASPCPRVWDLGQGDGLQRQGTRNMGRKREGNAWAGHVCCSGRNISGTVESEIEKFQAGRQRVFFFFFRCLMEVKFTLHKTDYLKWMIQWQLHTQCWATTISLSFLNILMSPKWNCKEGEFKMWWHGLWIGALMFSKRCKWSKLFLSYCYLSFLCYLYISSPPPKPIIWLLYFGKHF